jgi:NlpC/P60 family
MKFHYLFQRLLVVVIAVLVASGCRTRKPVDGSSKETAEEIKTTTGLPYWPPGPVYMIDPPPGFQSYSLVTPLRGVPLLKVEPAPLEPPVRPFKALKTTNEWVVAALPWMGTPYRVGGKGRDGIDCSAYVAQLHREVAKRSLPRTTKEQWDATTAVGIAAFKPGDLVFFNTLGAGTPSHVGVFLGDRTFTHAGTTTGVTVASLDDNYWSSRFLGARRVIR